MFWELVETSHMHGEPRESAQGEFRSRFVIILDLLELPCPAANTKPWVHYPFQLVAFS